MKTLLSTAKQILKQYAINYHSRRQLLALDEHLLTDIAISRSQALAEARRPFWQSGDAQITGQQSALARRKQPAIRLRS